MSLLDIENFSFSRDVDGETVVRSYNIDLLKENGVDTPENRETILKLHLKREHLFDQAKSRGNNPPDEFIVYVRETLEQIEFDLQAAWGFEPDRAMHTWWNRIPNCSCPREQKYHGTGFRMTRNQCIYHGDSAPL